jgi:hypothetical protein
LAVLAVALHAYVAAIVLGSLGLFSVPAGLDAAAGRTKLTPQGLETRSLFRKHSCSWDEVDGIDTASSNARGSTTTQIVVRLKTRKPFKLCAPYTSAMGVDPCFDQRLEQIKAYRAERTAG